jgi:uncharacterized protein YyaL (SSP411 family)
MDEVAFQNHLVNETSPYLLQHSANPVDWYPWSQEALEKAKRENKLIIVSVGYAACHWCHVMAHESFEDEEVAAMMNENFVCIKVDREERPDVDQVYMDAVQLMTGSGGWPLNVIAMPDGRPVYGGTYFPKARWLQVLKSVSEYVKNNPARAEEVAANVTAGLKRIELIPSKAGEKEFMVQDLSSIFANWRKRIDNVNGGYLGAPKFPMPSGYQFLLQYWHITGDKAALDAVTKTLTAMAFGGIYDHLGGGFARYSTDEYWRVPHFEKMLYDNAQLVSLYAIAFQATKDPLFKKVMLETLGFIRRELATPEGGFWSSIDADSEGEEGNFYVWSEEELERINVRNSELVADYFNVSEEGNWEDGKNVLYRSVPDHLIASRYGITEAELSEIIEDAKQKMFSLRSGRIRPATDEKILSAWNGLMIKGYIDAWRVTGEIEFREKAITCAKFIIQNMIFSDGRLDRNFRHGGTGVNGFLDDYAFVADAFISIYQATFKEDWLREARNLVDYTLIHFHDTHTGMFYYTSDADPPLITRKIEISENVIPSANSVMAKNLFVLGKYFENDGYIQRAAKMAAFVKKDAIKAGPYYANWDMLIAWLAEDPFEVAIVGDDFEKKIMEFNNHYLPNAIFCGGSNEGALPLLKDKLVSEKTTIYVCRNKTCSLPVNEAEEALKQMN